MEQLFADGRLRMETELKGQPQRKETFRYKSPLETKGKEKTIQSQSDLTIYERAVKDKDRTSTSSEEGMVDTSDELINITPPNNNMGEQKTTADTAEKGGNNEINQDGTIKPNANERSIDAILKQFADSSRPARANEYRLSQRSEETTALNI